MIWRQTQQNYFYGEHSELSVTAEGLVSQSRLPLNADSPASQMDSRLLKSAELQQLVFLLQSFIRFEQIYPAAVIPDDFPWICRVKLNKQEHQLEIYSNSPAEQRELFNQIQMLLRPLS